MAQITVHSTVHLGYRKCQMNLMSSPSHNYFVTNSYTHNNLWRVLVRDRRITIIRTEYCWGKLIKVCKETQNGPSHRKIALNDEDQCHSLKCHINIYSLFRRQYLLDQKAFHLYLVKTTPEILS